MDRRANMMWIYAIGVVLIITNAASGVSGVKPDNSTHRRMATYNPGSSSACCQPMMEFCGCNMVKTRAYRYEHIFPIILNKHGMIDFKFKVKAESDAYLMFSMYKFVSHGDYSYEIVLGAKNNTLSLIRKWIDLDSGASEAVMKPVLSPNEWREFWVQIVNDGAKVGRKGEKAFMQIERDAMPYHWIRFFSVAGGGHADVLWSLPCSEERDTRGS
ncbi:uncharacterized protein LOC135839168 [Planococcus citri]|uniref:uncharacterized protein LOC135839168 n=1 Tax=Planococcus citri TaxID=170843 RepID=UPI0031F9410B